MLTFASIFTGIGGCDIGLRAAGLKPVWGIELDPIASALYANHFGHSPEADLLKVSPRSYPTPSYLHISPPCQSFSGANVGGIENEADIELSKKTGDFIAYHRPRWVSIENVAKYQHSSSFKFLNILLGKLGYNIQADIVDLVHFGVPQSRRRLIVRASLQSHLWPLTDYFTHGINRPLVSWWDAVADLVPAMPESTLTPRQQRAIAKVDGQPPLLVQRVGSSGGTGGRSVRAADQPCWTIKASSGGDEKSGNRTQVIDVVDQAGQSRSLSMRGCARLMTFPDDYELPESFNWYSRWSGLGNAVPPLAMKAIAESLIMGRGAYLLKNRLQKTLTLC